MIEYLIHKIDPEKDLLTLDERVLRLPRWRRRKTLYHHDPLDRLQSAITYELLATLLRKHYNIQTDEFRIGYESTGKPYVVGHDTIYISLSHCRKGAMAVVADKPVGCDIEEIPCNYDEVNSLVAEYCFSENERNQIKRASDKKLMFIKIWTIKEALFKLDNSIDIEHFDTSLNIKAQISSVISSDYVATIAASDKKS